MKAYLDIDVGSKEAFETDLRNYTVSQEFYLQVGPQLGLSGSFTNLDEESASLLAESFASDPKWSSKAAFTATKPKALKAGRLVIELFSDQVPKTVENFRCLLTGERGKGKSSGKNLHYKTCAIHRVISGFMVQGGDIVRGDGSGGDSIYGGKFNDEKPGLKLKHDKLGVVGMANSGKNSNTSQFYITLAKALPQLNGKHVIFGQVVDGLDVLQRIDTETASTNGQPKQPIWIADCGLL